jgi:hypothetical protein
MPHITRPQITRVLRKLLPHCTWTPNELLVWLAETEQRNEHAKHPHSVRRLKTWRDPKL